jgi:hypothetical protein
MFSIYRKNDAHLVGKKDVKKKKIVHSRSLNMKKIILFMLNFDNIKFVINGKYSQKIMTIQIIMFPSWSFKHTKL